MKTVLKVVLAGILAIAAGFGCRYILGEMGILSDPQADPTQIVGNGMVEARSMFLEKPDEFQTVTAALLDCGELEILRSEDGTPMLAENGVPTREFALTGEAKTALEAIFGDYECGGQLLQIRVKRDAVLFYTGYPPKGGSVGIIYELQEGGTRYYDYVDLVENWKLFYRIPVK